MSPKRVEVPPAVVMVPGDEGGHELRHERTLAPRNEQYAVVWPTGFARYSVTSEADLAERVKKTKVKKVKKKHEPGPERYERNPHEPIKC